MCEIKACLPKIIKTGSCMLKLQKDEGETFFRQHCIDSNLCLGMAILICVQNLAGTGLGVAPENCIFWNINARPTGMYPLCDSYEIVRFVGTSMSDLNSQFDCICLRSLDFIGFYLWGVSFHKYFSGL